MKVRVYFNLHKKLLSVQTKVNGVWKVIRHTDSIALSDVTFKVSERGRQRVIKNKRKNVHAYICGTVSDEPMNESGMVPIIYNPYKFERFFDGTGYIDTAEKVFVNGRKVYAK